MTENGESTATMPTNHDTELLIGPLRRSANIGKLTEALAKASLEFAEITKDTENPFYKSTYADLATLIKATRPALGKHGLVVIQFPIVDSDRSGVTTLMSHISDQWIEGDCTLAMTKKDAQGAGSAMTYARRYAYQAVLNVAGEEDDDGNAATGKTKKQVLDKIEDAENNFDKHTESDEYLAIFQMREIQRLQKQNGITDSQLLAFMKTKLGVDRVEKVKKTDFETLRVYVAGQMPIQEALQAALDGTGRTVVSKLAGEEATVSVEGLLGSVAQKNKGDKTWLSIKMQDGFELSDWHIDHEQTLKPYVGQKVEFLATAKGKGDKTYFNVDSLELQA